MKIAMLMTICLLMTTMAVVLTPGMVNAGTAAPVADPAADCKKNFNSYATARHTCKQVTFTKVSGDKYRVGGDCKYTNSRDYQFTDVVVPDTYSCGNLLNCNAKLALSCN